MNDGMIVDQASSFKSVRINCQDKPYLSCIQDSSNKLPATATNNFNLILIGLALIVVGTLSFIIVRKKTQKSSN